jgi:hypothetical protein
MTDPRMMTRREMLTRGGGGFGAMALASLLGAGPARASDRAALPSWTTPARAKSCIFVFIEGGPSHIDLFDPKPLVNELAGQKLPPSFKPVILPMGESNAPLMASQRKWKQHGQGGLWISDWLPEIAGCADDLAVIRSARRWAAG